MEEIERVVVSHFHADHLLDLFALAFARHNPALAGVGPIELVGHHLTPGAAARLARAAGAERLLLSHFYPSVDSLRAAAVAARTFAGPIEVAADGSCHPV